MLDDVMRFILRLYDSSGALDGLFYVCTSMRYVVPDEGDGGQVRWNGTSNGKTQQHLDRSIHHCKGYLNIGVTVVI